MRKKRGQRRRNVKGRLVVRRTLEDSRRPRQEVESLDGWWTPGDGECQEVETFCPMCGAVYKVGDLPRACCGEVLTFRCPWVSCKWHLYLDTTDEGDLLLTHPDLEPWELPVTCAIDFAIGGSHLLREIGDVMNMSRERVRQVQKRALAKLRIAAEGEGLTPDQLEDVLTERWCRSWESTTGLVAEEDPDIDYRLVRKAYRQLGINEEYMGPRWVRGGMSLDDWTCLDAQEREREIA